MDPRISITKDDRPGRAKPWLVRWYGEYDVRTGKQRRYCKSFKLRKDAEHFAEAKKQEFQSGMSADQKDITLKQLCERFMETRPKSFSVSYKKMLNRSIERLQMHFAPTTSVRQIQVEHAQAFIANLESLDPWFIAAGKELADSTIDGCLRQAKTIFSTAQEWGYIKTNPFKKVKVGKLRKREWHFVTVEEFNTILDNVPTLREKVLFGVMYWCGLRYGEAANLRWDGRSVDFDRGEISVVNRAGTKTLPPFKVKDYESRTVPMNTWVIDMLKKLQAGAPDGNPYVFVTSERLRGVQARWEALQKARRSNDWENRYVLNNVLKTFKRRCEKAGIKTDMRLDLHGLRKSWAMNLANSGRVPPKTLLELGGWSSIRTCEEFYLKNTDANRQRACDVLNELAGGAC